MNVNENNYFCMEQFNGLPLFYIQFKWLTSVLYTLYITQPITKQTNKTNICYWQEGSTSTGIIGGISFVAVQVKFIEIPFS